jgi:hypothetical protein
MAIPARSEVVGSRVLGAEVVSDNGATHAIDPPVIVG